MKTVSDSFIYRKNLQFVKPIYLYAIQYEPMANKWLYYTSRRGGVEFAGREYKEKTISHDRMTENVSGRIESVNLAIANLDREIQYYIDAYNGLKQRKILIKTVYEEELDDPTCFDEQEFYIKDCTATKKEARFTLASKFDVLEITAPRRKYIRDRCQFRFKGTDGNCGYTGIAESCNRTIQRCIELNNISRFGAMPAIPMKRGSF